MIFFSVPFTSTFWFHPSREVIFSLLFSFPPLPSPTASVSHIARCSQLFFIHKVNVMSYVSIFTPSSAFLLLFVFVHLPSPTTKKKKRLSFVSLYRSVVVTFQFNLCACKRHTHQVRDRGIVFFFDTPSLSRSLSHSVYSLLCTAVCTCLRRTIVIALHLLTQLATTLSSSLGTSNQISFTVTR